MTSRDAGGRISWSRALRGSQRRVGERKRWLVALGISGPGGEVVALGATEDEAFAKELSDLLVRFAKGDRS